MPQRVTRSSSSSSTATVAPAMAKSPWRRANSCTAKPQRPDHTGNAHRGEDLVGVQATSPTGPVKNSAAGICLSPAGRRRLDLRVERQRHRGVLRGGSACAIAPPSVPRVRIWKCPMCGVDSVSSGTDSATSSSMPDERVRGGRADAGPRRRRGRCSCSSSTREMSTRFSKWVSRMASIGTRLCPPARIFASSPYSREQLDRVGDRVGAVVGERSRPS